MPALPVVSALPVVPVRSFMSSPPWLCDAKQDFASQS
jgi:hypothetical protein